MREIAPDIVADPAVRFGKPVIKGTRIPVDLVIRELAGGMKPEDLTREYGLTAAQVLNALRFAAAVVAQEEVAAV